MSTETRTHSETAVPGALTGWAAAVANTLAEAGVRDVVVSPGSRSTPYLMAIARVKSLSLHPVVDERSASFMALGMTRVSGRPTALLCTSGSAPAHYFPAVIEASETGLPLVVLSADRPSALAHSGAPQTTDQTHLFGRHCRFFADLGDPRREGIQGARRAVATAVAHAWGPDPGPVHINARAAKPLEPSAELGRSTGSRAAVVPTRLAAASDAVIETLREALDRARRPALVAGPMGLDGALLREAVTALGDRGVALFAECASQLRLGGPDVPRAEAFDLWLPESRSGAAAVPDLVIEIGATPTSAGYARWLAAGGPERRFVLAGARPRDPSGSADAVVLGDVVETVRKLTEVSRRTPNHAFLDALAEVERRTWASIDEALASYGEAAAVRQLARALPKGALLALGNSLPIRHGDRALRRGDAAVRVIAQRGVNGIDGGIAGGAGAALASAGPLALVIGDVAAAHDAGSLATLRDVRSPLLIMVLDNRGGRIFEQLPIAEMADAATMRLFTTPPSVDFESLADAYGVAYAEATDSDTLARAIRRSLAKPAATLLRVIVEPHGAAAVERRIRSAT